MFTPRKTNEGIDSLLFWTGQPYTLNGKENIGYCTWYVLGRVAEILGYPMNNWKDYPNSCPNKAWNHTGAEDAKHWLEDARWKTSKTPQVCSVIVLDGYRGHVAFIEEDFGDGYFGISQCNKNSDRKFHYEKVSLKGTTLYGMKILGYLIIPYEETKRDETKWQIQIKVNQLRMRANHSTNSDILGLAKNGAFYNIVDVYNDDYRWLKTEDSAWIATKAEWVDEHFPINDSKDELREANKTILALKEMNRALDDRVKFLEDKIEKIKELL